MSMCCCESPHGGRTTLHTSEQRSADTNEQATFPRHSALGTSMNCANPAQLKNSAFKDQWLSQAIKLNVLLNKTYKAIYVQYPLWQWLNGIRLCLGTEKDLWKDFDRFLYFSKKAKSGLHKPGIFRPLISVCWGFILFHFSGCDL